MQQVANWEPTAPLVIAHRGASAYAPENTITSFNRAIEIGADAIELDVKLTRDGVIVVFHDNTLDRTTNGIGSVRRHSFEEVKCLEAGAKFNGQFISERIPILKDVIKRFGHVTLLNIEITNYSSPWDDLPERVIRLISELNLEDRVLLSSFNPIALVKCHLINRRIKKGLLLHSRTPGLIRNLLRMILTYDFFLPHEELFHKPLPSRSEKIIAWTVNQEDRIKELLAMGITGIITDVPDIALRVREDVLGDEGFYKHHS